MEHKDSFYGILSHEQSQNPGMYFLFLWIIFLARLRYLFYTKPPCTQFFKASESLNLNFYVLVLFMILFLEAPFYLLCFWWFDWYRKRYAWTHGSSNNSGLNLTCLWEFAQNFATIVMFKKTEFQHLHSSNCIVACLHSKKKKMEMIDPFFLHTMGNSSFDWVNSETSSALRLRYLLRWLINPCNFIFL